MAKFYLLFEFDGCIVQGHSSAKKVEKSLRVSVSRFEVASNEGSTIFTIGLFYSRCDFNKITVSNLNVIIKIF